MKLLFDDSKWNSNPNIDKNNNIIFVKINGEKGMKTINIKKYIEGVKKLKKLDAVYFDWDLTLSRIDSIDFQEYLFHRDKIKYKKMLQKYFGSDIRRQALRTLFRIIRKKGGHIYILTRNPTAYMKNERIFFPEILNSLEGNRRFTLHDLHYCPPNISKSAYIRRINS